MYCLSQYLYNLTFKLDLIFSHILLNLNDTDKALLLADKVVTGKKKIMDKNDPSYIISIHNLAFIEASLEQYDSSIAHLQEILQLIKEEPEQFELYQLYTLDQLSKICQKKGDLEQAEFYYKEVLKMKAAYTDIPNIKKTKNQQKGFSRISSFINSSSSPLKTK